MTELKPCPFCGGKADWSACDRLITIGCKQCGYERGFKGLLTTLEHKVKVNDSEYYNPNAHEEAIEAWNRRVSE